MGSLHQRPAKGKTKTLCAGGIGIWYMFIPCVQLGGLSSVNSNKDYYTSPKVRATCHNCIYIVITL